jgi:hypothetical protein
LPGLLYTLLPSEPLTLTWAGRYGSGSLCSTSYLLCLVSSLKVYRRRLPLMSWLVYFCCPETRGLSLKEIDLIFLKKGSLQDSHAAKILSHKGMESASAVATLEEGSGSEKVVHEEATEKESL